MEETKNNTINSKYDTTINIIGGLKDCSVIYKAIAAYFSEDDSVQDLITGRNEFVLRTERSKVRITRAINNSFLFFINDAHKDLTRSIFTGNVPDEAKQLILFWQFALTNQLFFDISANVFMKIYFSGRTTLPKDEIIAYLKESLQKKQSRTLKWSESTIRTLSTKYLNLMTKLNFLTGSRIKSFRHIKPSTELLILFLYFAKLHDHQGGGNNILKNEFLPLSFVSPEDIKERLKKLSLKGFFNMSFNGVALNVELTHSYEGICHALYNRA